MKKRMRFVIIHLLLCMVIMNGVPFVSKPLSYAAGYYVSEQFPEEIQKWHRLQGTGIPAYFEIDHESAWCIEPGKLAYAGMNEEISFDELNISNETKEKLSYIAYYGYRLQPTIDHYVLTQNLLWETLGTKAGNDAYFYVSDTYPTRESQKNWQNAVMEKVNQALLRPSFYGEPLNVNTNEKLILVDDNGVLPDYEVEGEGGLHVQIEGNQLILEADENTEAYPSLHFTRKVNVSGELFAVKHLDSQAVSTLLIEHLDSFMMNVKVRHQGALKIVKQDDEGNVVEGATFMLSYHDDMSDPIGSYTTGHDGSVVIGGLLAQNVFIQEQAVIDGLKLDSTIHCIVVKSARETLFTKVNEIKKGSLQLKKVDAETQMPQGEASFSHAAYTLIAKQDILHPVHKGILVKANTSVGVKEADQEGQFPLWEELYPGIYELYEIKAPIGYQLDPTHYEIVITGDEKIEKTVEEDVIFGRIEVSKKDAQSDDLITRSPTIIELFDHDGHLIQSKETKDGIAVFEHVAYGHYTVSEKQAPIGYLVDLDTNYDVCIDVQDEIERIDMYNQRVKGEITLTKVFAQTMTNETGEAFLHGNDYELRAHEDIFDPATGRLLYAKNQTIVDSLKTTEAAEDGLSANIVWENLFLGSYDVHEVESNPSLCLNENDITVRLDYENQNQQMISKYVQHEDKPKEQAYELIKIANENTDGEMTLLKGAEFTTKLKKEVEEVGWDNAKVIDCAKTDEKGYLKSVLLPYGSYIVKETHVPEGYQAVDDFIVTINENSMIPQVWRVMNDAPFQAMLKIVKKDAQSKKVILQEGTAFKIKNMATHEYVQQFVWTPYPHVVDTWTTTKEGIVYLDAPLAFGSYELEEVNAPQGYVLQSEPLSFQISKQQVVEIINQLPLITIEMENHPILGQLQIQKSGEQLQNIVKQEDGTALFVYGLENLSNTSFHLYAQEDIVDPVNDGSLLYRKGDLVETIMTDEMGKAISSMLPLGSYKVEEFETQVGMTLLDQEFVVEFCAQNQDIPLIIEKQVLENKRQQVYIRARKVDEQGHPLEYAKVGLFAKKEIWVNDQLFLQKDELIETCISDQNGQLVFKSDLPVFLSDEAYFYIKEIEAPKGFIDSEKEIDLDTQAKKGDVHIIENQLVLVNKLDTGKLIWTKSGPIFTHFKTQPSDFGDIHVPIYEAGLLENAQIALYALEDIVLGGHTYYRKDEFIQTLQSKKEEVESIELPAGHYYYVEIKAPNGYQFDQSRHFFEIQPGQQVRSDLWDDPYEASFSIKKKLESEAGISQAYDEIIFGCFTRSVTDEQANELIAPDQLVGLYTLNDQGECTAMLHLPQGKYYVKEIKTALGYELDEQEYDVEIKNDEHDLGMSIGGGALVNKLKKVHIQIRKIDSQSGDVILDQDFAFACYHDQNELPLEIVHADIQQGIASFWLPYGVWYIQEKIAPEGYRRTNESIKIEINEKGVWINEKQMEKAESYLVDVENEAFPILSASTEDQQKIMLYAFLAILSFIGIRKIKLQLAK